jgi:hypothetical protein
MKTLLRLSIAAIVFIGRVQAETPVATVNPGPTTRSLAGPQNAPGNVVVNVPTPPPVQVVLAPDPIHTIDLPLWEGYHYPSTVRVNVKMISAVVPHVATSQGVETTGSAVYCWPADIWYTTTDVATLTSQLASLGWGQGSPLVQNAALPKVKLETAKPYVNPTITTQPVVSK